MDDVNPRSAGPCDPRCAEAADRRATTEVPHRTTGVSISIDEDAREDRLQATVKPTLGVDPDKTRTMPRKFAASSGPRHSQSRHESFTAMRSPRTMPDDGAASRLPGIESAGRVALQALRMVANNHSFRRRSVDDETRSQMLLAAPQCWFGKPRALPHGMSYRVGTEVIPCARLQPDHQGAARHRGILNATRYFAHGAMRIHKETWKPPKKGRDIRTKEMPMGEGPADDHGLCASESDERIEGYRNVVGHKT